MQPVLGEYFGFGRCIIIEHIGGYRSLYAHMNRIFVKKGDSVYAGECIGTVGSTGFSTGTHLHYEVSRYGEPGDPKYYLNS